MGLFDVVRDVWNQMVGEHRRQEQYNPERILRRQEQEADQHRQYRAERLEAANLAALDRSLAAKDRAFDEARQTAKAETELHNERQRLPGPAARLMNNEADPKQNTQEPDFADRILQKAKERTAARNRQGPEQKSEHTPDSDQSRPLEGPSSGHGRGSRTL